MSKQEAGHGLCPADVAHEAKERDEAECTKKGLDFDASRWQIEFSRMGALHADGQRLIDDWVSRADGVAADSKFESFIYAWIGFNGWASCCCYDETWDRRLLQVMMLDASLNRHFDRLRERPSFFDATERFASWWPIFKASNLPEDVRRFRPQHRGRPSVVAYYQMKRPNAVRYPNCHLGHEDGVPIDWSHTLDALYQVRCNLFHGQKSGAGHEDRQIVEVAVDVLLPIVRSVVKLR